MLPKCPGLEGFKSLPVLFLNPIFCFHPPISKRSTSHGCQSYQVNRLQNGTRELCCKDTQSENVLGCFFLLITERAVLRMRHDSCLQMISRPATRNSENSSLDHLALFSHLHLLISEPWCHFISWCTRIWYSLELREHLPGLKPGCRSCGNLPGLMGSAFLFKATATWSKFSSK